MDNNHQTLDHIIADLKGWKPEMRHPDETSGRILQRIRTQRRLNRTMTVLRFIGAAASILLLIGLVGMPQQPPAVTEAMRYQQQFLSQCSERHYLQTKFLEKTLYDQLKQKRHEQIR